MEDNTVWKPIPGYEGIYEASNKGEIRSFDKVITQKNGTDRTIKGRVMKQRKNNRGYHIITLNKDSVSKDYLVHRLIAFAFLPNPDNLPQVNHIDGNKSNNCIENLEWCDQTHNMLEAYRTGLRVATPPVFTEEDRKRMSEQRKGRPIKAQQKPVMQMDLDGNDIQAFDNAADACKQLGFKDKTGIYDCCTNRRGRQTYMGYKWRYIDK